MTDQPADQLSPTAAARTTLPGTHGPLAALVATSDPLADPVAGTVLLLPGYTGSKEDFAPILDPLRGSGTPVAVIAGENDDAWPLPGQHDMATPGSAPTW